MATESGTPESGREPPFHEVLLDKWSRTRGPLFENPAAAICRILALCEVSRARSGAPERGLRIRAARMVDEALAAVPDSSRPATSEQRARVNMGLVDVQRAVREAGPGTNTVHALAKILAIADRCGPDFDLVDLARYLALAELLAAAMEDDSWELSLRAARTLLARTRDAARRVGHKSEDAEDEAPEPEEEMPEPPDNGESRPHPSKQSYECRPASSGAGPP